MAVQYERANDVARVTQTGFALSKADCIGAGKPDKSGFRFTQFRCKVFGEWRDFKIDGHITVWVTGRTSLRWKLI